MNDYPRVKDRSEKLRAARDRMPVNGIAMKRLLIERAAKARRPVGPCPCECNRGGSGGGRGHAGCSGGINLR